MNGIVEPLSKADKEQRMLDIQQMLIDDDIRHNRERLLRELINPNMVYDLDTPNITMDDSDLKTLMEFEPGDGM
jgi:hypothetical protein